MSRSVAGTKRKDHRKKILARAKGFWGRRHSNFKVAKDATAKAMSYSYRRPPRQEGQLPPPLDRAYQRVLPAPRISPTAAFIEGLAKAQVQVDRKDARRPRGPRPRRVQGRGREGQGRSEGPSEVISLEQVRALEDRVEKAVAYISSLREEGAELGRRLAEAQSFIDDAANELSASEAKLSASEAKAEEAAAKAEAAVARAEAAEAQRQSDLKRIRGGRSRLGRHGRAGGRGRDEGRRAQLARRRVSEGSGQDRGGHSARPRKAGFFRGSGAWPGLPRPPRRSQPRRLSSPRRAPARKAARKIPVEETEARAGGASARIGRRRLGRGSRSSRTNSIFSKERATTWRSMSSMST